VEFDAAPFGIVGLETELGLFLDLLVHKLRKIDIVRLIEMYTDEPARLLKIDAGALSPGASAASRMSRRRDAGCSCAPISTCRSATAR